MHRSDNGDQTAFYCDVIHEGRFEKKRLFYLNPAPAKHIRDGTGRVVRQRQEERVPDTLGESDESQAEGVL